MGHSFDFNAALFMEFLEILEGPATGGIRTSTANYCQPTSNTKVASITQIIYEYGA